MSSFAKTNIIIPTLWDSGGILTAWEKAKTELVDAKPRAVQLHTWSPEKVVDTIRKDVGQDTFFVAGMGLDQEARDVAKGNATVSSTVKKLVRAYKKAVDLGFNAWVANAEADWKTPPNSEQHSRLVFLFSKLWEAIQELGTLDKCEIWHTAYDHPASHSKYPWEGWLGDTSPVVLSLAQVYAGSGETVLAHRGKLAAREVSSIASWGEAVKKGWIDAKNCDWQPYYQLHHVTAFDTIRQACLQRQNGPVCLWAVKSRCDDNGLQALHFLCDVDRLGGLAEWQKANGLEPDGIFGKASAAKARVLYPPK